MLSIFQKILKVTAAAFRRGVGNTDKKRLKRSREVIIEASDTAWVNSDANPFNKTGKSSKATNVDLRAQGNLQNLRATGTRWSKLQTEDHYGESLEVMALRENERKEAQRRIEIVREHLQKRGQINRNLHFAKLADHTQTGEDITKVASEWSTSEPLTGDFCSLELLAEIEDTETIYNKIDETSNRALEILAINLCKPTVEIEEPISPAQIAARAAARAAKAVQAKSHARLQALQGLEPLNPKPPVPIEPVEADKASQPIKTVASPVAPLITKSERSMRPAKMKIRDTEIVPSAMREKKLPAVKPMRVEYKASIQPREEIKATDAKQSGAVAQSSGSDSARKSTSDTHEKIEERFAYRTSPEHALKLIAQSVDTPTATLARLGTHENPHIRTAVARNRSTNCETLWVLARDYEASIRYSLAESTHTPLDILRALTKDGNQLIAWVAQNSLNTLKKKLSENATKLDEKSTQSARERIDALLKRTTKTSGEQDIAVLEMTARADTTSAARLDELANHENARVRAAVAENSNTPLHALWSLVRDVDPNVKIKLTFNCNCPVEILEVIKGDKDTYVAQKARDILKGKNSKSQNGIIDAARNIRTYLTWP